jgi:hypothetical protein
MWQPYLFLPLGVLLSWKSWIMTSVPSVVDESHLYADIKVICLICHLQFSGQPLNFTLLCCVVYYFFIYDLFKSAVHTSYHIKSNTEMIKWIIKLKSNARQWLWPNWRNIPAFTWTDWENSWKSVRITEIRHEIWIPDHILLKCFTRKFK